MVDISRIMDYEQGDIDLNDMIDMFQQMIDDGTVWHLQGHYGRTACDLIRSGMCHPIDNRGS